jgi:HK97 family phage portal protein
MFWSKRRAAREREQRSSLDVDPFAVPPPSLSALAGGWSLANLSGEVWRPQEAIALPAVTAAIHLICESIASLPMLVYHTDADGVRGRATDSWQYRLLHDVGPNDESTPFDLFSDIAASLEGFGNAYLEKLPVGGGQFELYLIDPARVQVKRAPDRTKTFVVRTAGGGTLELGSDRILHVRGFTLAGEAVGLSPIALHRRALGLLANKEEFEREFFLNGASPGGVLELPSAIDNEAADEIRVRWSSHHQGPGRFHQPAILARGAQWKPIGISLADAQFAESSRFGVEQVARIFRIPPALLGLETTRPTPTEQDAIRFLKFSLGPRLKRIEQALAADPDLFPEASALQPEFLADGLLRADTQVRYEAYKAARQAGWLTANEIRAMENLPPDPRGDELQATPVGGAPNPPRSRRVRFARSAANGLVRDALIEDEPGED